MLCALPRQVREAAKDYRKVTAITKEMAEKQARLESDGYQVTFHHHRIRHPRVTPKPCCTQKPKQKPKSLTRIGPAAALALQAWIEARQTNDFSKFAPVLQEWVDLVREKCAIIDPTRCGRQFRTSGSCL